MKRIGSFLMVLLGLGAISLTCARAEDDVDGKQSTGKYKMRAALTDKAVDGELKKSFPSDVAKIYLLIEAKALKGGEKVRAAWIADDVGDAAPKKTKIDESTEAAGEGGSLGAFTLSKPDKGWPVGKYRIDIYVGDDLAKSVKFTIGSDDEESDEEGDAESGDE